MGILAVHITTAKIRAFHDNQAALGYLGHPGQIGGWWVPQNDVTMEAVRADDYFPLTPVRYPKSKTASAVFPDFQPSIFEFLDGGFCVGLVLSRRIHITNPRFLGPKW